MNRIYGLSIALASLTLAASASAQTFDMSWKNSITGDSNVVLTTTNVGEPAGEYLITGATGTTANLGAISGVQYSDGADNILYLNQGNQYASYGGITFTLPGGYLNIFSNGGMNEQTSDQADTNASSGINCVKVQAVPEPSSYAAFGFGAIGLLIRRRKK